MQRIVLFTISLKITKSKLNVEWDVWIKLSFSTKTANMVQTMMTQSKGCKRMTSGSSPMEQKDARGYSSVTNRLMSNPMNESCFTRFTRGSYARKVKLHNFNEPSFFSQIVGDMTNVSWIFVFDCWYIPVFDGPSLNSNLCVILNQADRIVIAPWTKSGGFFRRPGLRSYIRWTWCHPLRSGAVPWGGSRDGLNRVAAKLGNGGTSWDTESLRPDFF